MPDSTAGNRRRHEQRIPRIKAKDAARIFAHLEHLLESSSALGLRTDDFARFLSQLEEPILELAVQPDSWGERTRACLISAIMVALRGISAESASVEEIVDLSNSVMPCFLLELGRRKRHIEVDFPKDPYDAGSRFQLRLGSDHARHTVTNEQLLRLVTEFGEELVGLCYFGDQQSRECIDAEINRGDTDTNSNARP
jgi:hypothetical protein